jgi:hypothetical protein
VYFAQFLHNFRRDERGIVVQSGFGEDAEQMVNLGRKRRWEWKRWSTRRKAAGLLLLGHFAASGTLEWRFGSCNLSGSLVVKIIGQRTFR